MSTHNVTGRGSRSSPSEGTKRSSTSASARALNKTGGASSTRDASPLGTNGASATRSSARSAGGAPAKPPSQISQVFSHTGRSSSFASTSSSVGAGPDRLCAATELAARFCVHCRGAHVAGGVKHKAYYTVQDRFKALSMDVTDLARMYKAATLPAEKDSGAFGGTDCLRWKTTGGPEDPEFDLERWLPLFVDGARETKEPLRLLGVQGSKQMLRLPSERIIPLVPSLVAPLRRGLNTMDPISVAAMLDILRFLLTRHEGACDALLKCDGFRRMLPATNLMLNNKTRVRVGYDNKRIGGDQQMLKDFIREVLLLMCKQGGDKGRALIRSYMPSFFE